MWRGLAFGALATFWATQAQACRLALVLAMDVSSSVDAEEDALQRGGLATALIAPDVQAAFFATPDPVALAVFEWSGRYNQLLIQDWVLIDTPETLLAVSNRIAASQRSSIEFPTSLGYALGYAATLLTQAPVCDRQTVDVSGDGPNNNGFGPRDAYGAFPVDGVIINGLVIEVPEDTDLRAAAGTPDLFDYYVSQVIRGPGAFVEVANGFGDFARAMEVKLIRELGVQIIGTRTLNGGERG